MESELAVLTAHDSVDEPPTAIDDGLPLKLEITGAGITVTVVVAVTVPPSPVAVKVYVVVTEGVQHEIGEGRSDAGLAVGDGGCLRPEARVAVHLLELVGVA